MPRISRGDAVKRGAMMYRFVDRGIYYAGIPARDLTAEEVAALPEDLQKVFFDAAVACGVYVPVSAEESESREDGD
jgi:hypothetical protein